MAGAQVGEIDATLLTFKIRSERLVWGKQSGEPAVSGRPVAVARGRHLQGKAKIIAAILKLPVIQKILDHLGLDPQPPPQGRILEQGTHFAA